MPTPTYTPLANITLGSSAASVTFSSISQAYRDLRLVIQTSGVNNDTALTFNGNTGANYNRVYMAGQSSGAVSGSALNSTSILFAYIGSGIAPATIDVMDYSATDKHKTTLSRGSNTAVVIAVAGRWANTAAITSLAVTATSNSFAAGSTFELFGIAS